MGDSEDLYLTREGQVWYVSQQPDGSTAKVQLEEDIDGEINIVDDGKDDWIARHGGKSANEEVR